MEIKKSLKIFGFFFENSPSQEENCPRFENNLKWPVSEQQFKSKMIYKKSEYFSTLG